MKYGFIYALFKRLVEYAQYLNLAEGFKYVGCLFSPNRKDKEISAPYSRNAVDVFIVSKWIFVLVIWKMQTESVFCTAFVWYLIITNIYTYFYYHVWDDHSLDTSNFDKNRIRMRFLRLLLAVGFSNICYAYLYSIPYADLFSWPENGASRLDALWFSTSNSIAASYDGVKPIPEYGTFYTMTQLIITFLFGAIIISKSIPQTNSTH